MYDIVDYASMIAFEERTLAYARALEANVAPGAVVLDIGTGPGIMSFFACRAGAAKIYAVESEDIIQVARDAARDNGFSDRIEFIQALTTEVELPEKVDGIVAEIHGILPIHRKSIVSILDARDRFLKPEGWIVPARETVWAALACCPALHRKFTDIWHTKYGFDFNSGRLQSVNNLRAARVKAEELIVLPQRWSALDYNQLDNPSISGVLNWLIDRTVAAHGICMWYDCETVTGFGFSNSPSTHVPEVYNHAFFPWPEAVELMSGDQVRVEIRATFVGSDYLWFWDTCVTNDSARVKMRCRQSTFIGAPLSPQRLHKRGATFVPNPIQDARIDYLALELMHRNLTVGEIAKALLAEFPTRFKDWNAALLRVADLSEKYSR